MPRLAIIVPVYNEEKTLELALEQFHHLDMQKDDELLFVDGGSTDNTRQMILDAGFRCLQSEKGRAQQMNVGARNTESEIILFLHIDTSLCSSNISNIKKTYKQGFLSGRFNIKLSNSKLTYRIISFFINIRSCLTKVSTGDQGIFVARHTFEKIGGFPNIPLMEDIALSKQLKKVGEVACLQTKLITSSRRWEQHGVFKTTILMWKLRYLYWRGATPERLAKMYKDAR